MLSKDIEPSKEASEPNAGRLFTGEHLPDSRTIFVIHGRDERARKGLFDFLRSINLDPLEFSEAIRRTGKGSPYIGEVLDVAFSSAQAVVVLQTPDDVAYLHDSLTYPGDPETTAQRQPRPNVIFEAGMAMGRDEDRVIIVEFGKVKTFSDIHGRHVIHLDNSIKSRQELATRLSTAGCDVKLTGTDWHETGDLNPPSESGLPLGRKAPSLVSSGRPHLSTRYRSLGGNKIPKLEIINNGPGDLFELDITKDDSSRVRREHSDLPLARLPEGKSITVSCAMPSMAQPTGSHFYISLDAKTADGSKLEYPDEYVSTGD